MGLPAFCVSIGLEHNKETVLELCSPHISENVSMLSKESEHGSTVKLSDVPIKRNYQRQLSPQECPMTVMIILTITFQKYARWHYVYAASDGWDLRQIDLCYTAAGFFDAYWGLNLNRWDVSAGQLIAKEAVSLSESIRNNRNHSILASNPHLYPSIRKVLAS